jgi:hypothetical protein
MLELLAAAIVQLPSADIRTVNAVHASLRSRIRERVAGARVSAFADENGKVQNCVVISFSGSSESANAICRAFVGKTVKPAADIDGAPISGFIETTIGVTPNRNTRAAVLPDRAPDAQVTVSRLPEGQPNPSRFSIGLIIDQTGSIVVCGPVRAEQEAIAAAACQALEGKTFPIITGGGGVAIRYARAFDVEFSTEPATPEKT